MSGNIKLVIIMSKTFALRLIVDINIIVFVINLIIKLNFVIFKIQCKENGQRVFLVETNQ